MLQRSPLSSVSLPSSDCEASAATCSSVSFDSRRSGESGINSGGGRWTDGGDRFGVERGSMAACGRMAGSLGRPEQRCQKRAGRRQRSARKTR
jgi:hypothetical protein